jgi:hypothetical protein
MHIGRGELIVLAVVLSAIFYFFGLSLTSRISEPSAPGPLLEGSLLLQWCLASIVLRIGETTKTSSSGSRP